MNTTDSRNPDYGLYLLLYSIFYLFHCSIDQIILNIFPLFSILSYHIATDVGYGGGGIMTCGKNDNIHAVEAQFVRVILFILGSDLEFSFISSTDSVVFFTSDASVSMGTASK